MASCFHNNLTFIISILLTILTTVISYLYRGPFITALGRTWCPGHFTCAQASCGRSLQEVGFVEEQGMYKLFIDVNQIKDPMIQVYRG